MSDAQSGAWWWYVQRVSEAIDAERVAGNIDDATWLRLHSACGEQAVRAAKNHLADIGLLPREGLGADALPS